MARIVASAYVDRPQKKRPGVHSKSKTSNSKIVKTMLKV